MVKKTENLKLRKIECQNTKDYVIDLPKRMIGMGLYKSKIRITFSLGEYQYYPRKHTFGFPQRLTSEELRAIANKLDELNKENKDA